MTVADLDAVMQIEKAAYAVPWTRGNFIDSLASGYQALCLVDDCARLLGYNVAMDGAGEVHLLNLTVTPSDQRRGHARRMLDTLVANACRRGIGELWLEVRVSNVRARELYQRYGLVEAGRRNGYYPAAPGSPTPEREDAVVMRMPLKGGSP